MSVTTYSRDAGIYYTMCIVLFLLCRCLGLSKECVSRGAADSERFTSEVLCQVDATINDVTENTANQQSSVQQLNVLLSDGVTTSMEVCVCACVRVRVCVCLCVELSVCLCVECCSN